MYFCVPGTRYVWISGIIIDGAEITLSIWSPQEQIGPRFRWSTERYSVAVLEQVRQQYS